MSAVVIWRCVDCAVIDEVIATEPSRLLGQYLPEAWSLTTDEHDHHLVRCAPCTEVVDGAIFGLQTAEKG